MTKLKQFTHAKLRRTLLRLKQADAASRVGIGQQALSNIESGYYSPKRIAMLMKKHGEKIKEVYQFSDDELERFHLPISENAEIEYIIKD